MGTPIYACYCGHAIEEHGHDPKYPASTACLECDCIGYDADHSDDEDQESEE